MACKRSGVRSPLAPFFYYMRNFLLSLKIFFKTKLFFFILLTLIVFLLYGKSINYEFVSLDEDSLVVNNIQYLSDLKNIPYFFTSSCYLSNTSLYYRPVLTTSFAIEASLFGLNTRAYHFTNIVLFIFAIYLMYVFLLNFKLNNNLLKFFCLIIAVHPIFTSTVVWVPSRNDTLLAIFLFLSFIFFIKYLKQNKIIFLFSYFIFITLSLFTKESAILFIFLNILYLYLFDYKVTKANTLKFTIPLIIILFFYFYLRNISVPKINLSDYLQNIHIYFINFIYGTSIYLKDFFIPNNIPIFLYKINITISEAVIDIILITGIIILWYKKLVKKNLIIFSLLWFIFSLSTTFLLQDYVLFYHRFFLAVLGIIILSVQFTDFLLNKYPYLKKYFITVFIIIFPLFFVISFITQTKYQNKEIYWNQAYSDAPTWHATSYGLAKLYLQHGNYEKYKEFMFQAYNLSTGDIHIFNIMPILIKEGQIDKVKEICFNILQDKDAKLFHQLGANSTLGNIYLEEGNLSEAYKYLKTALLLDKNNFDLQNKVKLLETKLNGN